MLKLIHLLVLSTAAFGTPLINDEEQNLINDEQTQEAEMYQDSGHSFDVNSIKFYLYTRSNPNDPQLLTFDKNSIQQTHFRNRHTRFLIHGWRSSVKSEFNKVVKDALLSAADLNVIVVDWSKGSKRVVYGVAQSNVKPAGQHVASFINFLVNNGLLSNFGQVNMIGHSLGAHVAGIAGKNTNSKVAVIFGLDPARPYFFLNDPGNRLAKDDAEHTVVLHTNGGILALGFLRPLAKVDIYPNGGTSQPGCAVIELFSRNLDVANECAHERAYELFAEAVTSGFVARKCKNFDRAQDENCKGESVSFRGEVSNIPYQGIYYFETRKRAPFAKSG